MAEREYDVVVFGATGYTGRLVAEYLAGLDGGFRWAIAGRSRDKLLAVRSGLGPGGERAGLITASVEDPASLAAMAGKTRVVLNMVGPYDRYGEPVVAACVEAGTDHADITGEPQFVNRIEDRYDAEARSRGVRVVSCCGFDSVPHDLGAFTAVERLPRDVPLTVRGFVQASGVFSGGTWHSAVNAFADMRSIQRERRERAARLRAQEQGRRIRIEKPRIFHEPRIRGWAVTMPTIDPEIVTRSARKLDLYGPELTYGHYMRVKRLPTIAAGAVFMGGVVALSQLAPTRELLLRVKSPGEGPTPEQRAKGFFKVTFLGEGGGEEVRVEVSGGDPGYGETAKMASQCALCLALDRDRLPGPTGVLTPVLAMGTRLRERLIEAGIRFT